MCFYNYKDKHIPFPELKRNLHLCYFQGLYKAALLIASIMGVVLLSFTAETLYNNISSAPAAFQGLIPMFRGEIIYIAAGILGSNILPTNIYLQSALFEVIKLFFTALLIF